MKLITFGIATPLGEQRRVGALRDGRAVDLAACLGWQLRERGMSDARALADSIIPADMTAFLSRWPVAREAAVEALEFAGRHDPEALSLEASPVRHSRPSLLNMLTLRVRWMMAALVLAGLTFTVLQPRWVAAQALRRMEQAITDVRSAHDITWRLEAGANRVKSGESWYQGGKYRSIDSRPSDRALIFTNGKVWHYDAAKNTVTIWSADGPFGTARTTYPLDWSARRSASRMLGSSSTTRIVGAGIASLISVRYCGVKIL